VGATGGIVHGARGTGARERLGLLGIAVEAEKDVLSIVAPSEHQELVCRAIFGAGQLGQPGRGYLYVTPLDKVATYIPAEALSRLESRG
jgi:nitrogen regulatory protein PII